MEHMALCLQPILEKGIVDHSIIHRALVEYLTVVNKVNVIFDRFREYHEHLTLEIQFLFV